MSLLELSAKQLLAELSAGRVTAVEVAESYLSAIAQRDKQVGTFFALTPQEHWPKPAILTTADVPISPWGVSPACLSR